MTATDAARLQTHPDDTALQQRVWADMKNRKLSDDEIRLALDHAFNLVTQDSVQTWWVFDRRTAPEFVYVQPKKYAFIRDGKVVAEKVVDIKGNGVEVHKESSGRGPFAGPLPKDEQGNFRIDEFRFYYEVTYAPEMKWLEGYESFLELRLSPRPEPAPQPVCRSKKACPQRRHACRLFQPLRKLMFGR